MREAVQPGPKIVSPRCYSPSPSVAASPANNLASARSSSRLYAVLEAGDRDGVRQPLAVKLVAGVKLLAGGCLVQKAPISGSLLAKSCCTP